MSQIPPQNHTLFLPVQEKSRIWIPVSHTQEWFKEKTVYWWPLGWDFHLDLCDRNYLKAWRLSPVNNHDDLAEIEGIDSRSAAYLAGYLLKKGIGTSNKNGWPITIPKELRDMGKLPSEGGRVAIRILGDELSVWDIEAHDELMAQLSKERQKQRASAEE